MPTCLFCDNELDAKTRPEHVLLSALGGRKTSRRVVCSECNGQFGSTIDKELAESVSMLRAKLGHESGAGKPPPKSQYRSTHGMITVDNNGRSRFKQKPFAVQRETSQLANVSVCLICNPVNGKWTEDIGQFGDANAEWLSDARFNQRQATEWLSFVLQHAYELQLERAVGRLVRDEFLRHGIEGDRTAGEEIKQKVIGEISARVSALVLRLPYERAVAWETVEKALALTRGNV